MTDAQATAKDSQIVLVTGATGYVGSRLILRLLDAGYKVRATARSVKKLRGRSWAKHENVELVAADVLDLNSLVEAAEGCAVAYYLVHSMNASQKDFADADRRAARNMAEAADVAGVERIIYLGGLGEEAANLSKHLRSRAEVGEVLKAGKVPVTILRAAMIIGSGSASFEIMRYLVDRLPVMITPRWVRTPSQPIAIRNVLDYLVGCLSTPQTKGRTFDIGGTEVLTYQDLMDTYAEEAGLGRRKVIPVPFFTPGISSYWIHFVTPVPSYIARPLADGLRNPAVCTEDSIRELIPIELLDCCSAIKLAIERTQHQSIESHWTDAGIMPPDEWCTEGDPAWAGGTVYEDKRRVVVTASREDLWQPLVKLGGRTGWYHATWLWRLRGLLDRILGGVGLGRGRRSVVELQCGDALDFWRVSSVEPCEKLSLIAEMKLPGMALLEFRIKSLGEGRTELTQIARFLPVGLGGILYWKAVTPLHDIVFDGMLRGIVRSTGTTILSEPTRFA